MKSWNLFTYFFIKTMVFVFSALIFNTCLTSCSLPGSTGPRFDPHSPSPSNARPSAHNSSSSNSKALPLEQAALTTQLSPPPLQPQLLQPPAQDYTLGAGDKVEIEIFGEADTRETTFITPDGLVYYSALPGLPATGKTTSQLRDQIQQALLKLYRHPSVGVTLTEARSQRVMVMGRVNSPGSFPLKQPLRVLDAISQAGGLSTSDMNGTTEELADLAHSFLKRGDQLMPVDFDRLLRKGDASQNIYLQAGDFLYLPSSLTSEIYIMGGVNRARAMPFRPDMSLISAYGQAMGARSGTDLKSVVIVRGSLTQPTYARVDLAAILQGRRPDVRLEPGDIIYFPPSGSGLNPIAYVQTAVDTFTRTIGASEGPHNYPSAAINATALGLGGATGGRLVGEHFPRK